MSKTEKDQNHDHTELAKLILDMINNYRIHGFMHDDSAEYYFEKLKKFESLLDYLQSNEDLR